MTTFYGDPLPSALRKPTENRIAFTNVEFGTAQASGIALMVHQVTAAIELERSHSFFRSGASEYRQRSLGFSRIRPSPPFNAQR
jgi:hypothetical protein